MSASPQRLAVRAWPGSVLADPDVVRRMQDHGAPVRPGTPRELREPVVSGLERRRRVAGRADPVAV